MPAKTRRRLAAIPGAAALFACSLLAAASADRAEESAASDAGGVEALREAIRTAFRRCDAAPLDAAFSPRLKTYLASRGLGVRPGWYGAAQARLMLRRGFAGRRTVRFHLGAEETPDGAASRLVLTARWLYRDAPGAKTETRLSVTLAPEGSSWIIRELREQK